MHGYTYVVVGYRSGDHGGATNTVAASMDTTTVSMEEGTVAMANQRHDYRETVGGLPARFTSYLGDAGMVVAIESSTNNQVRRHREHGCHN